MNVDSLDHLVLNVHDLEVSAAWYQRVLGMERQLFGPDQRTALKFGGQKINLRPADTDPSRWPSGLNQAPGSADLCFLTSLEPDRVLQHLHDCGVAVLAGPVQRAGARGPLRSVYCRDPDGNLIEVSSLAVNSTTLT